MLRQALETLEYDQLRETLANLIRTPLGEVRLNELAPATSPDIITKALRQTAEGVDYLREGTALDFSDLGDPRPALGKLNVADINLEPHEILVVLRLISVATGLRDTFRDEGARFPLLREITGQIANLHNVYQRLRTRILPTGEIDDFASPELREVRFQIAKLKASLQKTLESILKRADENHALRDDYVTIRNDRYVIPIRNDNRGAVAGVVHGMSSSGQTAFVEPLETIEMNNDLVRLHEIEIAEITKVLFAITEELRDHRDELLAMADAVGLLDFIAAKARLALNHNAIEPKVNESGHLYLKDARHPLLEANLKAQKLEIVPISLELSHENRVMVVSGPNAGGKTVVLKTVGLLSLMAQSGLHVPATDADLPIFRQVMPDIGDHQSIAANLSTFTSHISNIRTICDELDPPALVLLDEVGTGTDPEEGSALGVAIVDYLRERGAHVIVTTHYSGLKIYATNTPGVITASVEFDERTLKPTYHLLTGIAGASSGIEIARRFGLPKAVTDRAVEKVQTSSAEATEFLKRLKTQREEQQQTIAALEEERTAVAMKYAALEVEFNKREQAREKEFRAALQKIVEEFVTKSKAFVASIEDAAVAKKVQREIDKRTSELKVAASNAAREMRQASGGSDTQETTPDTRHLIPDTSSVARDLQVGDRVLILSLNQQGVIESIGADSISVQVGALRFRETAENLRLIEAAQTSKQKAASKAAGVLPKGVSVSFQEQPDSGSELNVIGKTVGEATDAADKFLDAAYLNNHDRVRIVHGRGMGALKRAIASLLSEHPHVAKFYPAAPSEGGNGATIAELKK
ncbi:MAG TPA: endonuclease MutS2 [Blastocatellia bacterium]|nr:endonuclease MutS2 [Blastocatellia bacterium]